MTNRKTIHSKPIRLRVSPTLLRKIDKAAKGEQRTRSDWIRLAIVEVLLRENR